jgi:pectate disaccharide-lyase
MKRSTVLFMALVFGLSVCAVSVFAKDILDANTLKAEQVVSQSKAGVFTIIGTSEKGVTVEVMDKTRKAKDGSVFKSRIKLNGAGDANSRSISFTLKKKAKVTVYLNSSSKTEARTLLIANKGGDIAGEMEAAMEDEINSGEGSAEIAAAGEYFIYSKKSGINIYKIVIE